MQRYGKYLETSKFSYKKYSFYVLFLPFRYVFSTFCLQFIAKRPFTNIQNTAREIITDGIY